MRRARVFPFVVVSGVVAGVLAACSLQDGGGVSPEGVDGGKGDATFADGNVTPPNDATSPPADASTRDASDASDASDGATVVDAGHDAGPPTFSCGSKQVASCATDCPSAPHDCPSSKICVGSCFPACVGATFQCDACGTDAGVALSRCEPEDASAYAECLVGLNRCPCSTGSASACPGMNQTCENDVCFECAEPDAGDQGHACEQSGKTCRADGSCQ
jgi:hypothetical protein